MQHRAKPRWVTRAVAAELVVFACAASAGIHAGLVPEHLREEPRLGVAFTLAVITLLATGAAVAFQPWARRVARISALLLGGLIAAYAASRTTGIPLLAPDPEAVDAVGIAAISIELVGLICALWLGQPIRRRHRRPVLQEVTR
jgi:hypothetical protein